MTMTTTDRLQHAAHGLHEVEVHRIEQVLARYGTLTRETLQDLCGAAAWREDSFEVVLRDALAAGRIRQLTPDLYTLPDNGGGG
jgi:hypothetical protein